MRARECLDRGWLALQMMEEEDDFEKKLVLWTAGVSIVRSIGHVLRNVDAIAGTALARRLNEHWPTWRNEPIFAQFVETERNALLKEGNFGNTATTVTYVNTGLDSYGLDHSIYWPLDDGPYANEDCRDVLKEALDWWEAKLAILESAPPVESGA